MKDKTSDFFKSLSLMQRITLQSWIIRGLDWQKYDKHLNSTGKKELWQLCEMLGIKMTKEGDFLLRKIEDK